LRGKLLKLNFSTHRLHTSYALHKTWGRYRMARLLNAPGIFKWEGLDMANLETCLDPPLYIQSLTLLQLLQLSVPFCYPSTLFDSICPRCQIILEHITHIYRYQDFKASF